MSAGGGGGVSSFQKKGKARVVTIPGSRPSIHNSQLLISSGLPSLDHLLGGGLPVGSLLLLEQDKYDVYSKLLLKYFIAEGVMSKHMLTVASLDESPASLVNSLPAPVDKEVDDEVGARTDGQMSIAWRYQNQHSAPVSTSNCFSHAFDLTQTMDGEAVRRADLCLFDGKEEEEEEKEEEKGIYWRLLQRIEKRIRDASLNTASNKAKTNVMRLAIHSLASPLWGHEFRRQEKEQKWDKLTTFLYAIRALLRSSLSVGFLTVPAHLFHDTALALRLHALTDHVLRVDSFQGSDKETNPLFKDYHGLFHVIKLSAINSLVPHQLDTVDWVFKLRRRRMVIERLHLPPLLSDTPSRSQQDPLAKPGGPACMGEKLPRNLEF